MEREAEYQGLIAHYDRVKVFFDARQGELAGVMAEFPWAFSHRLGMVHGIDHWTRVGILGLAIAGHLRQSGRVSTPALAGTGALEDAVLDAAFFHDSGRRGDGVESDHGIRGNRIWTFYARDRGLDPALKRAVSQAILFHSGPVSVDPRANAVTVCLCNADRLDRVRLGDPRWSAVRAELMYDDGAWPRLAGLTPRLLREVKQDGLRGSGPD